MATSILSAITYARQLSQTDSNGISDTTGLAFANDALQNMTRALVERNINASKIVELTIPLVAGTGKYNFPDGTLYTNSAAMFSLKTIEVNFSDSTQQNYLQPEEVEISNAQGQPFDWLRVNQSTRHPLIANYGGSFEIFPTPVASNASGIKIVYFQVPTEYPDVGSPILYPATLDYRMLGARISSLYALTLSDFSSAQAFEGEYQKRLKDIINILAPVSQTPITAEILHISGWQF